MEIYLSDDMSLGEALLIAKPNDTIYLDKKEYFEKVVVEIPYLTIIGNESTISFDAYSSLIIPGTNKKYGTSGSATLTIKEGAHHFKLINTTVLNKHKKTCKDSGEQAVAFKSEASFTYIEGCSFKSYQDTFLMDNGFNNLVINSHIEGDIDFIFGSADCMFYNCEISGVTDFDNGYYFAPSTYVQNDHGFVCMNCTFNQLTKMNIILARRWFPSGAYSPVYPRLSIANSKFIGDIELRYKKMRQVDPEIGDLTINSSELNGKLIDDISKFDYEYVDSILKLYNIK